MERIVVVALALSACSGESWLRLNVSLAGGMPQPASLRVDLDGASQLVALGSKALPGSLIIRHLPSGTLALEVDGLDAAGRETSQASAAIALHSGENDSSLTLGPPPSGADAGIDLASADLAGRDLSEVDGGNPLLCPSDAIFCDDFETGDISKWATSSSKPAGVASFVIDGIHARNQFAFDGQSGTNSGSTFALVETFVTLPSPSLLSARFYVYAESFPGAFAIFYGEFGGASMTDGYAVGVDGNGNWVVPQDQANNPDLTSTLAMTYNAWHCVELVVDYVNDQVELDVDGLVAIRTTPAMLTVPNDILAGLTRAPGTQASRIWFDDFALATHRIGCE